MKNRQNGGGDTMLRDMSESLPEKRRGDPRVLRRGKPQALVSTLKGDQGIGTFQGKWQDKRDRPMFVLGGSTANVSSPEIRRGA